jgi:hypothetical protein
LQPGRFVPKGVTSHFGRMGRYAHTAWADTAREI